MVVLTGCGHYGFSSASEASADAADAVTVDTDARQDAVALSTCAGQSVLLCEGFEAPLGSAWTSFQTAGTVGTTSTRSLRGGGSLESITNAVTGLAPEADVRDYISRTGPGPLFGRIWVYVRSPFPAAYNQFLTFADVGGGGIAIGVDASGGLVSNDFADGSYLVSATALPLDRWVCLVLEVPSNQTGLTRVYVDDVEVTDITQSNTTPQTAPDQIYVGQDWGSGPGVAATMWLDELIVDSSPITCAQ